MTGRVMPDWVRRPRNGEETRHAVDWTKAFIAGCEDARRHLMKVLVLPLLILLALAVAAIFYFGVKT